MINRNASAAPNNGIQLTALRAAADAERSAFSTVAWVPLRLGLNTPGFLFCSYQLVNLNRMLYSLSVQD
jgi:hypothetical protein